MHKGHLEHVGRVSKVACGWLLESCRGAAGDEGAEPGMGAKTQGSGFDLLMNRKQQPR